MQARRSVDVAIIGAGTAGLAAYRAATAAGKRALLIEGGDHGTTCARVGCMPSKLLIAAAEAARDADEAHAFGVRATVEVDGRAVMDRVRRERDRFVGFVLDSVERIPASDRVIGFARFVSPHVLAVSHGGEETEIEASAIVIATGSAPHIPPMFEVVRERLVVNDDVFMWETLPRSVAVFGAGVIGLELGQALSRLGVRTRVFGRGGGLGPLSDPAVKAAALEALREDVPVDLDAKVKAVSLAPGGVAVDFVEDGRDHREIFEYALVAAGRRPRLASLGLDRAGVEVDVRGVPKFDRATLQCGTSHVFIAGDAGDDIPLLHEAADEGKIAGENAARYPDVRPQPRRSRLAIVFTDPQIAIVGSTYADLAGDPDVVIGEVSFADQGRSRVMLMNRGLARIYVAKADGRLLGAEIAGPRAEHIGHLLAWAHQQGLTVDQMLGMPFYHPVVEEGLRTALRDANAKLRA